MIALEAGDAVPADARLMECASLKVEEAALTGESVPVDKHSRAIEGADNVPLGDRANMVYMGCTVAYGRGKAVVTQTGMDTQVGKIAGALLEAKEDKTPLQKKLSQLSRILTWLVLGVCGVIFAVDILRAWPNLGAGSSSTPYGGGEPGRGRHSRGLATVVTIVLSIGVTNMFQAQRHHPADDRGRNPGLRPGDLHRQDRHPDPEPDEGGRAPGPGRRAAGPGHGPVQRCPLGAGRRCGGRAYRVRPGGRRPRPWAWTRNSWKGRLPEWGKRLLTLCAK